MLVHRSPIDCRETVFLLQSLRRQIGRRVYPLHRLDKPTSGVMLFALDSDAAGLLGRQFEERTIDKCYWAVVRGWTQDEGRIDAPLKIIDEDGRQHSGGAKQPALTHYRTLARVELPFVSALRYPTSRYSWVEIRPQTGRKHQIRRHFKHIFHPLLGDTTHGDLRQNHAARAYFGTMRLMLHARSLDFVSPDGGQRVSVSAPTDEVWQQMAAVFPFDGG